MTIAFVSRSKLCAALSGIVLWGAAAGPAHATETQTLISGVKIVHTTVGTGAMPTAVDRVKVHYRGTLPNGTEFDSSYKEGPATFPLNKVIRCWTQALQHMKVGGKATLSCPAELAYGSKGAGDVIPPNTALTFDVELLGIEK
ncbi:MAG: peptidylprolyl isomerase [Burkholderiales bacterium PBB4]|nr:MAG: peptidylprolyl isomerase [Burkholderiales bacterium PBB4]